MRSASLISIAALAATVVADDAYLWTIDHGTKKYSNTQASSISPETASGIIARRRGFADDQYLASADAHMLKDINQFGGYQMPMYGAETDPIPDKVLIRISGYTGTVSSFPGLPDLWIEDATRDLADDFKARKDVQGVCEYNFSIPTKEGVELIYSYFSGDASCKTPREVQLQPTVLALFSTVPTAKNAAQNMNSLLRTLSHLSITSNLEATILILPPKSKLLKASSARRTASVEEPLELPSTIEETVSETLPTFKATNSSHPLPQFIPQCFISQESCENTTNSCSGHGSCYKAHGSCYKCKCGRTLVRENADGTKKTVQWGGNACQKKDVSMEFVLFASFGVVMAALIAGAIGAMYNMGSQELPSVIGAGVAGPKASK